MEQQVASLWRKSSYSGSNGGDCVECGNGKRVVLVRDTKNRAAGHLEISSAAWSAFLTAVK